MWRCRRMWWRRGILLVEEAGAVCSVAIVTRTNGVTMATLEDIFGQKIREPDFAYGRELEKELSDV